MDPQNAPPNHRFQSFYIKPEALYRQPRKEFLKDALARAGIPWSAFPLFGKGPLCSGESGRFLTTKYNALTIDSHLKLCQNRRNMSRWNVKTSTLILLGSVVCVVLLLVVLPDVDPPDTAFHRGTAPVIVHAQATAAPPIIAVASGFSGPNAIAHDWVSLGLSRSSLPASPVSRPILLCSIRC